MRIKSRNGKRFTTSLLKWDCEQNTREMPWKGEKDPYKIWLSEVILQQTRVEQGWSYYKKFTERFPDIISLARASDERIYKMWEGLGYYSRCSNLIHTARLIAFEHKGKFPEKYDDILKLKGVGPYTAAAISSFAFNQPYAVVDGNVYRVLSRYFGIDKSVDTAEGKTFFSDLALQLLDKKNPGRYNQALMDFGAVVCKPVSPACVLCPLAGGCVAFKKKSTSEFPVKSKTTRKKTRWLYYIVAEYRGKYLVRKRDKKDIWRNLHEFLLVESNKAIDKASVFKMAVRGGLIKPQGYKYISQSALYTQQLSHQKITGRIFYISYYLPPLIPEGFKMVSVEGMKKRAFPRLLKIYLENVPVGKKRRLPQE